jgi:hypothetical protein
MTRWLITSAIYAAFFLILVKFDVMQAIVSGLMCGGISILALKLFGMDKKE